MASIEDVLSPPEPSRGGPAGRPPDDGKDPKALMTRPLGPEAGGWLKRMSPLWWAHRRVVAIALIASVISSATLAVTPLLQKVVIDSAILHHTYRLAPLLELMGGVFALQFLFSGIRRFSAGRVSWDIDYDLRNTVFGHLQGLDFARHDQLQTGQLVSSTNSDLVLIRTLLTQLPLVLANVLQFLLAVVIMAHLSLLLTAIVVPLMPLLFFLAFRMRRVVYPSSWEMQARMAEMVGAVDDSVSGVRVVKGFGQEDRELARVTGTRSASLYGSRMRNWRLRSRRTSTLQTIPQLGQVVVLALGRLAGLRRPGHGRARCVAFFSYLTQLASPARQMAGVLVVAQQARAGAERVLELLDSLPDVVEQPDAIELAADRRADQLQRRLLRLPAVRAGARRLRPGGAARARRWRWSGRRARASRRSGCCSPASTTSSRARCASTASTSAT